MATAAGQRFAPLPVTPPVASMLATLARTLPLADHYNEPSGTGSAVMVPARRTGKVYVVWSQNDFGKSTVAPYSLRGFEVSTVSTPVTWEEVSATAISGDAIPLTSGADAAVRRAEQGDLFAPV